MEEFRLFDYQNAHKQRLQTILHHCSFALDFSMLGMGKTYTTTSLFREGHFKYMYVIAPVSVKAKWKKMGATVISFSGIRSVKSKQPKHGLLHRRDYVENVVQSDGTVRCVDKCAFQASSSYKNFIQEGILLVVDEIQNIKNSTAQSHACRALIDPIVRKPMGLSRLVLLSGSPLDKEKHVVNLFRTLGIVRHPALCVYNPQTDECIWRGMREICEYFSIRFGQQVVETLQPSNMNNARDMVNYCWRLFLNLLKPELSHSMAPNVGSQANITKRNAFFTMATTDLQRLLNGINSLKRSTGYNADNGTIGHGGLAMLRGIQLALVEIETSKIGLWVRLAQTTLQANPFVKVVLAVNYTQTVVDLLQLLAEFTPLRLDGRTKNRASVMAQFQAPDTTCRLLIANISVCSTGVDLDDKDGRFPRVCFVSPNYNTITLYQLSHRFLRATTRSRATVNFTFGKHKITELSILNALSRKGKVMKSVSAEQADAGVVFPGDYPTWVET